jgi:hypothetical protein
MRVRHGQAVPDMPPTLHHGMMSARCADGVPIPANRLCSSAPIFSCVLESPALVATAVAPLGWPRFGIGGSDTTCQFFPTTTLDFGDEGERKREFEEEHTRKRIFCR